MRVKTDSGKGLLSPASLWPENDLCTLDVDLRSLGRKICIVNGMVEATAKDSGSVASYSVTSGSMQFARSLGVVR